MGRNCIYNFIFPNLKIYVGQTVNFKSRVAAHKNAAKKGTYRTPIYNAIRKYGWGNIKTEVLLYCSSEDVDELERLYISKFNTLNRTFGYNLDSGGVLNKKHSSSTREKISQTNKSKSAHTFRTQSRKICAYTPKGEFVAIYESASEAARVHGVASNTISRVARGGRKTSCGYVWKWLEN